MMSLLLPVWMMIFVMMADVVTAAAGSSSTTTTTTTTTTATTTTTSGTTDIDIIMQASSQQKRRNRRKIASTTIDSYDYPKYTPDILNTTIIYRQNVCAQHDQFYNGTTKLGNALEGLQLRPYFLGGIGRGFSVVHQSRW